MRLGGISLLAITLTACGPSQEEIDNAATITCNIMSESSNMDAGMRIKEVNAAREKIGASPYLGTDETIRESLDWDLCEELIKNNPNYVDLVVLKKEAKARRVKEERQAQAQAEAEAKEAERVARAESEKKYRELISDFIAEVTSTPKILNMEYSKRFKWVDVDFDCGDTPKSLHYQLRLEFDGASLATKMPFKLYGRESQECGTLIPNIEDAFFIETDDMMSKLRYAELEIKHAWDREEGNRLHPINHGLSYYGLENGIVWVLFDQSTN